MDVTIQNPSITSGAFAAMLAFSSDNNTITAISGHPIAGVGGGSSNTGYWRPSVDDTGDISWAWSYSPVDTPPDTMNIMGPEGQTGANGEDACPITATTATTTDGTQVTISYTSGGEPIAQFVVYDGIDGASGFSPTVSTAELPETTAHPQGGTQVTITDENGAHQFNVWNGINGEGASINLLEGTGIQIQKNGVNYTIGVSGGNIPALSAGYASSAYISENTVSSFNDFANAINAKLDTTVAAATYQSKGNYASATDISDMATQSWVGQQDFITSAGLAANTRYEMTNAGWTSAIKIQVVTTPPTADDGVLYVILDT